MFYILACSLFTLGRCGKTLYCSAGILRPQGFGSFGIAFLKIMDKINSYPGAFSLYHLLCLKSVILNAKSEFFT